MVAERLRQSQPPLAIDNATGMQLDLAVDVVVATVVAVVFHLILPALVVSISFAKPMEMASRRKVISISPSLASVGY